MSSSPVKDTFVISVPPIHNRSHNHQDNDPQNISVAGALGVSKERFNWPRLSPPSPTLDRSFPFDEVQELESDEECNMKNSCFLNASASQGYVKNAKKAETSGCNSTSSSSSSTSHSGERTSSRGTRRVWRRRNREGQPIKRTNFRLNDNKELNSSSLLTTEEFVEGLERSSPRCMDEELVDEVRSPPPPSCRAHPDELLITSQTDNSLKKDLTTPDSAALSSPTHRHDLSDPSPPIVVPATLEDTRVGIQAGEMCMFCGQVAPGTPEPRSVVKLGALIVLLCVSGVLMVLGLIVTLLLTASASGHSLPTQEARFYSWSPKLAASIGKSLVTLLYEGVLVRGASGDLGQPAWFSTFNYHVIDEYRIAS